MVAFADGMSIIWRRDIQLTSCCRPHTTAIHSSTEMDKFRLRRFSLTSSFTKCDLIGRFVLEIITEILFCKAAHFCLASSHISCNSARCVCKYLAPFINAVLQTLIQTFSFFVTSFGCMARTFSTWRNKKALAAVRWELKLWENWIAG